MKVFYSSDYIAAAESFDTMRKSGWIAESLASEPIEGVEIVVPGSLSFEEIAAVHSSAYVMAVQTGEPRHLAESQGFTWDPGLWQSVIASTGGVVAAALEAMATGVAGSLSCGLHHARYDKGSGFCTFNGLAIAAKACIACGAESVLILDVDAHCGGGTHSLIKDDPNVSQIDISVSSFDSYAPAGENTLDHVTEADKYLEILEKRLSAVGRAQGTPALCLYNSGMDPDGRCGIGGLSGMTASILKQREKMVFDWFSSRSIPIAFVMAGGYNGGRLSKGELVALHRMSIESASLPG